MANKEHVREVIARIEADPDGFEMDSYARHRRDENNNVCGTTLCIAGHAAVLNGAEVREDGRGYLGFYKNGTRVSASEEGWDYLELTEQDFYSDDPDDSGLFYTDNETAMVRLKELAA